MRRDISAHSTVAFGGISTTVWGGICLDTYGIAHVKLKNSHQLLLFT